MGVYHSEGWMDKILFQMPRFFSNTIILYDLHVILGCFHMILYGLYVSLSGFHMMLYGFHMVL